MFPFRTSADCPGSPASCQPAVLIQASSFLDRQTQDILKLQFSEKGLKALNTLRRRLSGRRLRHNGDGLQTGSGDKISGRHHRLRPTCTELTAPAPSAGGRGLPRKEGLLGPTSAGTLFPDLLAQMIAFSTSVGAATHIAIWWQHS